MCIRDSNTTTVNTQNYSCKHKTHPELAPVQQCAITTVAALRYVLACRTAVSDCIPSINIATPSATMAARWSHAHPHLYSSRDLSQLPLKNSTPRTDETDETDQTDQIDQIDPNLPTWHAGQDLRSTDPTQETCARTWWSLSNPATWARSYRSYRSGMYLPSKT